MKDNTWITVQSQQLTPLYSIPTVKEFANPFVNSNLSQSKQVWPTVMVHSLPSLVFSLHLHSTSHPNQIHPSRIHQPPTSETFSNLLYSFNSPSELKPRFVFSLGLFSCYFDRISIVSTPLSLSKAPLLPTTKSNFASPMLPQSPKSGLGCSWIQDNSKCPDTIADNGRRQCPLHSVFPTKPAAVSSVEDLFEFICSGPLLNKLGLTTEMVAESINKWLEYGLHLCRLFQLNELYLTIPQKARLYHYYIPVFLWCEQQISLHSSTFKDGEDVTPLVIGFSAPQGCGKTTLVFALDYLFQITGRKSATISIDDFYLTAADQAKLRENNPKNGLLEFRGNAGSHDLSLSVETLTALSKLTKEGMKMKLPRYDKPANSGRGDRADPSTWPEVEGPLTVVLFEGWMLGFRPLPVEAVKAVDPQLEIVNKNLEAYYDAWDKFIKAWIIIKIKDPSCVYQWRLQAEIAMRADGKPGMSDEEVMDFVSRYLPAYKAYLPTLYSEGPNGSDPERLFVVEIDEGRNTILGN